MSDHEPPGIVGRERAVEALRHLVELMVREPNLDRVVDGYLETRHILAGTFRQLAEAADREAGTVMDLARAKIAAEMRVRYSQIVPEDLIVVRRYGGTHALLLAYLRKRVGAPVLAARLRILTGDQVHTERRVRELRDLGFDIEAAHAAGQSQYTLRRADQDLATAAAIQMSSNVQEAKAVSAARKQEILAAIVAIS